MKHRAIIVGTLFTITILDGILKYLAITTFPSESDPDLSSIFAFALHKNPGITFDLAIPLTIITPITILIVLGLAHQARSLYAAQPRATLGIIAVIIGAVDNLIDRMINGFTTDYLMFFKTSVINLADVLIVLGAIMILVYYKPNPHQRRA